MRALHLHLALELAVALLLAALLLSTPAAAQRVLFVDADATGAADGTSWADAFADLQAALAMAEAGDAVWVAEGTYRPADGADRDASFVLASGVSLYGGFDGTETELDERDPAAHVTVLSGDVGAEGDISDNVFHVVVASGVDSTTVLDGFTITGGNGNGVNPRNRGGGIYAENSSLVVRDCRIVENRVVQTDGFGGGGGAFFGTSGAPRFERVTFERNGLDGLGGGLWLYRPFEADTTGAAPLSAVFREVTFAENTANFGGGAIIERASAVLVHVTFERNVAYYAAGGLLIRQAEGHFVNVGFYGNTIPESGDLVNGAGGMWNSSSTLTLTNAAFVGNTARLDGGLLLSGASVLTNVTFTANEAEEGGGIGLGAGADLIVRNGVFWGNGDEIGGLTGSATLSHALIAGGCPEEATCESLLSADPLFVRPPSPGLDGEWGTADDDYGDLRLQAGSPAMDFGLAEFLPPDTFDLDGDGANEEPLPLDLAGDPRVLGSEVDLGPYEGPGSVVVEPETSPVALGLDAYPNPARGPLAVALTLSEAAREVRVSVFDVLGREVAVVHAGPLGPGAHAFALDGRALAPGLYVVRATGGGVVLSRRVTVVR